MEQLDCAVFHPSLQYTLLYNAQFSATVERTYSVHIRCTDEWIGRLIHQYAVHICTEYIQSTTPVQVTDCGTK